MTRSLLALIALAPAIAAAYEPAPENLAAREWFQDAKVGVFIHWGVYSELGRGEWVMNTEEMTVADYEPLAERFNPTRYDPDQWCRLFKEAGAKYITITSKHHDGFCLWDSGQTDWDVVDRTPYARDLLKPLAEACRRHDLRLFFYYSHLDWRHPDYYPRGRTGRSSGRPEQGDFDRYVDYMNAQLAELLGGDYGDVAGVWFDGWWDQQSNRFTGKESAPVKATQVDWRLDETYQLIHRLRPACLIGANHHVEPFPGEDFQMFERDLPGQNTSGHSRDAVIGDLPLETCDTVNGSWGYYAGDDNFKSVAELVHYVVRAAGANANLLLNVGPKPDGTIDDRSTDRLQRLGDWLQRNGEAVYGSRGGPIDPQPWGVTTRRDGRVYVHLLDPPEPVDGWTTLSGSGALAERSLVLLNAASDTPPVDHRLSNAGDLELRLDPAMIDAIDTVLVTRD